MVKTNKQTSSVNDSDPTPLKLSSNGNCITFHTSNPHRWYNILSDVYHDEIDQNNPHIISNWIDSRTKDGEDKLIDTTIKYSNRTDPEQQISVTITLYHARGTIMIQGAADCIETWSTSHHPRLLKRYQNYEQTKAKHLPVVASPPNVAPKESPTITVEDTNEDPNAITELKLLNVSGVEVKSRDEPNVRIETHNITKESSLSPAAPEQTHADNVPKHDESNERTNDTSNTANVSSNSPTSVLGVNSNAAETSIEATHADNCEEPIVRDDNNVDQVKTNDDKTNKDIHPTTNNHQQQSTKKKEKQPKSSNSSLEINHNVNMNNQLITNNRVFIENMEKEFIRRMTAYETRYEQLYSELVEQRAIITELQLEKSKTTKTIQTLLDNNKQIAITEKLKKQHDEETNLLQSEINEQKAEITKLRMLLAHKEDMQNCKQELLASITDNDTKCKNRCKEEKQARNNEKDALQVQINELETSINMVKDVVQKQLQKQPRPIPPIPAARPPCNNFGNNTQHQSHQPKHQSQHQQPLHQPQHQHPDTKSSNYNHNKPRFDAKTPADTSDQSATEDEDEVTPQRSVILNSEVIVLMDSNRKYIPPHDIWGKNKTKLIRVGMAAELKSTLSRFKFPTLKQLIISTGTNDTDSRDVDDIVFDIIDGAKYAQQIYPDAVVYVSQLLPRRDYCQVETGMINEKLERMMPESVHLIKHENLNISHMHDDKHVRGADVHLIVTNMTNKMLQVMGLEQPPQPFNQPLHQPKQYPQRGASRGNRSFHPLHRGYTNRRNDNQTSYTNQQQNQQHLQSMSSSLSDNHNLHQQTDRPYQNQQQRNDHNHQTSLTKPSPLQDEERNSKMERMMTMLEENNRKMIASFFNG